MNTAVSFDKLLPFANVSALTPRDVSINNFRRDVLWAGSTKPVVFTLLESVHSSNIINPLQLMTYKIKSLTVVPFGESWHRFETFLASVYGAGEMQGPFEYGCLLRLTSRREGGFGNGKFFFLPFNYFLIIITVTAASGLGAPGTPRKNLKAFASSRPPPPSAYWFERKQPSCLNFADDSK